MNIFGRRQRGRKGGAYTVIIETAARRHVIVRFDNQKDAKATASAIRRGYYPEAVNKADTLDFEVIVIRRNGEEIYRQKSVSERFMRRRYDMG